MGHKQGDEKGFVAYIYRYIFLGLLVHEEGNHLNIDNGLRLADDYFIVVILTTVI